MVLIFPYHNKLRECLTILKEIVFILYNLQKANILIIHRSKEMPNLFLSIKITLNILIIHYGIYDMFIPYVMVLLLYGKIKHVLLEVELQILK